MRSTAASSASLSNSCVKERRCFEYPRDVIARWMRSRALRHAALSYGRLYRSAMRIPRSTATQHMSLLYVYCLRSLRTSQIDESGSIQRLMASSTILLSASQSFSLMTPPNRANTYALSSTSP